MIPSRDLLRTWRLQKHTSDRLSKAVARASLSETKRSDTLFSRSARHIARDPEQLEDGMPIRNLPLNTWIVVEQVPSRERPALISTHDCQRAAEVECDRRNRASSERRYRACIL